MDKYREEKSYDPHKGIDMYAIGVKQYQIMTDAYVRYLSDNSAVVFRLEYRENARSDTFCRTQYALTPKQAKWLGQRLLHWGNLLSSDGGQS